MPTLRTHRSTETCDEGSTHDLLSGRQMNRPVQGDVGSGKTIVALMCMLLAVDNGFQACLMAPTEILATQHFQTISPMTAQLGLNVRLLTGSTKTKERRLIATQLAEGTLHILVGTHAVIEDKVEFRNLGFAVIDEQHCFRSGAQRARLWAKSVVPPHVLVMTATPIPRTLAMIVYGDLDVSVIDELPPEEKHVVTVLRAQQQRPGSVQGRKTADRPRTSDTLSILSSTKTTNSNSKASKKAMTMCAAHSRHRRRFRTGA